MKTLLIYVPTKTLVEAYIDPWALGFQKPFEDGYYLTVTREPSLDTTPRFTDCFYIMSQSGREWVLHDLAVEILTCE